MKPLATAPYKYLEICDMILARIATGELSPGARLPIPVKFLGFAEDLSRPGKVVSLSVNGSVVLAREGDVVDGRYRLIKVGLESITMTYLDGQGRQIIRQ